MSSEMSSRGPRLEASLILFASKECSDRACSFRKGKAERLLHSSTLPQRCTRRELEAGRRLTSSHSIGKQ